ncbi:MAG: phage capsid protein [Hyphomicrobium sp.]
MSQQIPTHYAQQFSEGVQLTAQQTDTRLRGAVRVEPVDSADREFFDYIGKSSMTEREGRHAKTVLTDTPHTRRMVTTKTYDKSDGIDKRDESRVLNKPINGYTRSYAGAANRQTDQVIIDSALATAYTGVDGTTPTSFDSDFQIAHNSQALTLAKVIEARKKLIAAENDRTQPWYFAYGSEQMEDLLNNTTVTSIDYNSVKMLATGEINNFLGFTWIQTELLAVATSVRSCLAWVQDALLLGITDDVTGDVSRRNDLNNMLQLHWEMDIGATRMSEVGVVEIQCSE